MLIVAVCFLIMRWAICRCPSRAIRIVLIMVSVARLTSACHPRPYLVNGFVWFASASCAVGASFPVGAYAVTQTTMCVRRACRCGVDVHIALCVLCPPSSPRL